MIRDFKELLKKTPIADFYTFTKKCFIRPRSQNNETEIIKTLVGRYRVPHVFIEFGFSGWEFNCASLIHDWEGLLVDGDAYNVRVARKVCSKKIEVRRDWLTLESLEFISEYGRSKALGILSIDVDGNDYWFLKKLIHMRPAVIIAEYNSSFGLRPITVPYDPEFDRVKKHESRTYYGASLSALCHLTQRNDYCLMEVGNSGINAFFVRKDLLTSDDIELEPNTAFREKYFADGSRSAQQWDRICDLQYVDVTNDI